MEKHTPLIQKEEVPPLMGILKEVENFNLLANLALSLGEDRITKANGEPYSTLDGAIRHGLKNITVPYVHGLEFHKAEKNPADRAKVLNGTYVLSTSAVDHTGQVVDPMLEYAYKNRITTVELLTGHREVCGCGVEGCFIHPVEKTGTGSRRTGTGVRKGNCAGYPTGEFVEVGSIGKDYGNKYDAGLGKKVPIISVRWGRLEVVGWRTVGKRSGQGNNPTQPVTYRYATTCPDCPRGDFKTCWGLCVENSELRFALVNTALGRTVVGIDQRRGPTELKDVHDALEATGGVVVWSEIPPEGI